MINDVQRLWHSGKAEASGAKLFKTWVQIPLAAGLFSILCTFSSASLIQVPRGGTTLLIFLC